MNNLQNNDKKSRITLCSQTFAELPKIMFHFLFWMFLAEFVSFLYKQKLIDDTTNVSETIVHFINEQLSYMLLVVIGISLLIGIIISGSVAIIKKVTGRRVGWLQKIASHAFNEVSTVIYAFSSFFFASTTALINMGKMNIKEHLITAIVISLCLYSAGIVVQHWLYLFLNKKTKSKTEELSI